MTIWRFLPLLLIVNTCFCSSNHPFSITNDPFPLLTVWRKTQADVHWPIALTMQQAPVLQTRPIKRPSIYLSRKGRLISLAAHTKQQAREDFPEDFPKDHLSQFHIKQDRNKQQNLQSMLSSKCDTLPMHNPPPPSRGILALFLSLLRRICPFHNIYIAYNNYSTRQDSI